MSADESQTPPVSEGELAGWQKAEPGDTFNGLVGAYYYDASDTGNIRVAFKAEKHHLNGGGSVHGGCLLTLADTAVFIFAYPHLDGGGAVTVQLDAQFLSPGREGDIIVASGEITRAGRTLIYGRGQLMAGERTVMTFTAILARTANRGDG
ncbi:MAG: PaaI family thioesterase [Asticcacaulis sp.]